MYYLNVFNSLMKMTSHLHDLIGFIVNLTSDMGRGGAGGRGKWLWERDRGWNTGLIKAFLTQCLMCGVVIWVTAEVQRCSNVIAVVHRCVNGFGLMFTPRSETLRPSCQILTCVWCVICVVMRCDVFMAVCRDVITALICMSVTTASLMIPN